MTAKVTPKYELLVDGGAIPPNAAASVISISCRQDNAMADTVEVRLRNDDLRWIEDPLFEEGKKLSVKMGYCETDIQTIVTAEIVRRECDFPERGPAQLTVVALDKEFRLKHGKKSRIFSGMKDSDVVTQLAGEAGLSADVDDSQVQHGYLFQMAQTNLEYIRERAHRLGWVVQVDRENSKLSFKKPGHGQAKAIMLKWGDNLLSHRPRFSTDEMIKGVEVRGWDIWTKKALIGKAQPAGAAWSKMGLSRLGPDLVKGDVQVLYPREPMFKPQEAEQMAIAYANELLANYAEGEASCQGENKIFPGAVVEIQGCGKRASGNYYVVSTLHHFESKGYTTYFAFSRPADVATAPPPPTPPPPAPPPSPPQNKPSNKIDFKVMVGKGIPYDQISYTATLPDGSQKQGTLGKDGKVSIDGISKAGDASFELKSPPDTKAFQPGEDKK